MELVFVNLLTTFGNILIYGTVIAVPIVIIGTFVGLNLIYKHRVIIHEPHARKSFTTAYLSKKGQLTLRKPKMKIQSFDAEACSIDPKGNYIFDFFKENSNTFRQVKPVHVDSKNNVLVHQAEDKSIDYLTETWKKNQKSIWTLEGFEKYQGLIFLGFIVVFNIVSMAMLLKAAGLQG
tara:strand:+ start:56 stop:589 length:534 start_codon:yes stop_codon:yes gene_type:complete